MKKILEDGKTSYTHELPGLILKWVSYPKKYGFNEVSIEIPIIISIWLEKKNPEIYIEG